MQLLDPTIVKSEKDKREEEHLERIKKLQDEENALIRRVNDKKSVIDEEIKKIDSEFESYKAIIAQKKSELNKEIKGLQAEVMTLEFRKKEALKPIDEIRIEAEKNLQDANQKAADNERDKIALEKEREDLMEAIDDIANQKSDSMAKNIELNKREGKIIAEEQRLKESAEKLATNWVEFHKEVHETNKKFTEREKMIEVNQKANNSVRLANEQESLRLVQERRAIHDTYLAIAQAKKHLNIIE